MSVIILVADGARPDSLARAMDAGELPTLAQLRDEGGLHTVSSTFPSVTGPAYTPFLLGRYPGPVGLPGLRWFDRSREVARGMGASRSYVGYEFRKVDEDLAADAPTLFELVGPGRGLGALNVIGRGLEAKDQLGRGARFATRAARTHFSGNVRGWLDIDRDIGREMAERVRRDRPHIVFCALTGIDKTSHAAGHDSPLVLDAMRIVDETAAQLRTDAERDGTWADQHIWVVSDHGHSPVTAHDDLASLFREWGQRTIAHPWTFTGARDAAVMVSGNAMAHVYVELDRRTRPWWPEIAERWEPIAERLLERPSVDVVLLPHSTTRCEVRGRGRGAAFVEWNARPRDEARYSYRMESGDPLGLGACDALTDVEAYGVAAASDYPDCLVQIAHLAGAPRSGEIIISAAREWDFRAKYEPIPHLSSHGALHREHMLVPLLVSRPASRTPRRTVDVMPSALAALGLPIPTGLDGVSFL